MSEIEKYGSVMELAQKVVNEGGVTDAILSYGIPPVALPDDVPLIIKDAWQRVYSIADDVNNISDWLDEILDGTSPWLGEGASSE